MEKRGQFYLLAAIIIIAVIIGFVAVSNYSKIKTSTKIYNLGEELEIESAQVLDYGTYSEFNEEQMSNLLEGFIEAYSEYGEIEKLYFIFGNLEKIIVMGYQELEGEIYVETSNYTQSRLQIGKKTPSSREYFSPGNKVKVTINEVDYEFKLKPGENFYFIIFVTEEGEEHVYVGGDEEDED